MIHLLGNFLFTAVTLDLVNSIFTPETTGSKIRIERKFPKTFVFTTTSWLEGRKRVLDSLLPAWNTSCSFSCFLFSKRRWEGLSKPTTRHRRERFWCWCDVSMHRSLEWVLDKSRLLGKGISLNKYHAHLLYRSPCDFQLSNQQCCHCMLWESKLRRR